MRKTTFLTAAVVLHLIAPVAAHADYIDDQLAKAHKRVENAAKNLAKWEACAADRTTCLEELADKAQKAADRAAKKLADIQGNTNTTEAVEN